MSFPAMQLTNAGKAILIKALTGETVEFTKVSAGNGSAPANFRELTSLRNPVVNMDIISFERGEGCAKLECTFDNSSIATDFWWRELGVYANDPQIGEVLYAYSHAGDHAEHIPAYESVEYIKTTLHVVVAVGDAEHVTAVIGEYSGYASKEEFDDHVKSRNNPHRVTKEDVGLGNVPNVATNDQAPTYSEAENLESLTSGEKISAAFGKIKKAISSLITHLKADNPHGISLLKIGAAAAQHEHSASDMTTGVLGVARGGTGQTSIEEIRKSLGISNVVVNSIKILNNSGYVKYDSGLMVLYGHEIVDVISAGAKESQEVAWTQPFVQVPTVFVTCETAEPDKVAASPSGVSASGCTINVLSENTGEQNVYVLALGRWKAGDEDVTG